MSLRVHCDWCEAYIYQTTNGQNVIHLSESASNVVAGKYVFCNNGECLQKFVRWRFLGEHIEETPQLVEVQ